MTRAGGGTVSTTSRWISPNGTRRSCESYCHWVSRSTKARALVERLTQWQYDSQLLLVPFGEIQREVVLTVPPPARVIVYRRLMVRIAEALARRHGAAALTT